MLQIGRIKIEGIVIVILIKIRGIRSKTKIRIRYTRSDIMIGMS